jgi:hypothetical protein
LLVSKGETDTEKANGRYEVSHKPIGKWSIYRNLIPHSILPKPGHTTGFAHGTVENFSH